MNARIEFNGLYELKQALKNLPDDLVAGAGAIVSNAARSAAAADFRQYPVGKPHMRKGHRVGGGTLKNSLRLEEYALQKGDVSYSLRNVAPHATIYDKGTLPRRTLKGKDCGVMPAGQVFIPNAIHYRQEMREKLVAYVRAAGFQIGAFGV